jgi:transcriptional regulator of acetoin/glycerol metabolism
MVAIGNRLQLMEQEGHIDPARRARRDALPEHTSYNDTGCEVHKSCLTCPLVRCRYDEPGGVRRLLSEERDRVIVALQRRGTTVDLIAQRFGISRRTVFRVLARARTA